MPHLLPSLPDTLTGKVELLCSSRALSNSAWRSERLANERKPGYGSVRDGQPLGVDSIVAGVAAWSSQRVSTCQPRARKNSIITSFVRDRA